MSSTRPVSDCSSLRIAFAGTPDFAVPTLDALIGSEHRLVGVLTQPDRQAGRGQQLRMSPVKQRALQRGIEVAQPPTLKDGAGLAVLEPWRVDVLVVVAYGLLLPADVLALPPLGCLNVHASLLPRWRGAAPIQRALVAGDTESGVGIMLMDTGLDTGPVLAERRTEVGSTLQAPDLHDRLAQLGAETLLDTLGPWCRGEIHPEPQSRQGICLAPKLDKAEAVLDWQQSARAIHDRIRGLAGWPVAETTLDGERIRVHRSALPELTEAHQDALPGEVLDAADGHVRVATADGVVELLRLQREGRKPLEAAEFVRGLPLHGRRFGT